MTDRIDPGPGWRLLKVGERKPKGYEWFNRWHGRWQTGENVGELFVGGMDPCRVRITPRTTKAIATRATVRAAFFDGAIADDVMRRDSGLSGPMMNYAMRRWEVVQRAAKIRGAKYIMLEIQREGEP